MKKITIEITEDMLNKLKAYTKAENYDTAKFNKENNKDYNAKKTFKEIACSFIKLELDNLPEMDDAMLKVYNKELSRLRNNIK